ALQLERELSLVDADLSASLTKLELAEAEQDLIRMDVGGDLGSLRKGVERLRRAVVQELSELAHAYHETLAVLHMTRSDAKAEGERSSQLHGRLVVQLDTLRKELAEADAALFHSEKARQKETTRAEAALEKAVSLAEVLCNMQELTMREKDHELAKAELAASHAMQRVSQADASASDALSEKRKLEFELSEARKRENVLIERLRVGETEVASLRATTPHLELMRADIKELSVRAHVDLWTAWLLHSVAVKQTEERFAADLEEREWNCKRPRQRTASLDIEIGEADVVTSHALSERKKLELELSEARKREKVLTERLLAGEAEVAGVRATTPHLESMRADIKEQSVRAHVDLWTAWLLHGVAVRQSEERFVTDLEKRKWVCETPRRKAVSELRELERKMGEAEAAATDALGANRRLESELSEARMREAVLAEQLRAGEAEVASLREMNSMRADTKEQLVRAHVDLWTAWLLHGVVFWDLIHHAVRSRERLQLIEGRQVEPFYINECGWLNAVRLDILGYNPICKRHAWSLSNMALEAFSEFKPRFEAALRALFRARSHNVVDGLSFVRLIHRIAQDPRRFLETKPVVMTRLGEAPHGKIRVMHED
ncbi:MAG: hypothetical protein SGPRY_004630, partial [Prymnesium sp.]